jgi:tetratricopeptide (TPR) repeat protein
MTSHPIALALAFLAALSASSPRATAADPVKLSEVDQVIPTYLSDPPDPNPMFYFGRESQGAQGRIYPYPLYDNLTNTKADRTYRVVYLENEYIRIAILPEIGGRLFQALDKTDNYDFIYHQHVIKPSLIGLIGAWISGGIEWNIPHHHRASTFQPVQYRTEENPDGSKTIWVGELELRQRMRWAVGYTLRPGRSVLECSVRILNRTPLPNSMLCFANVAVSANDNYQVIFPPSTQWVTYHGKRDFAEWPIAHTRFNGTDFSEGVDVSWYKNHIGANSMFAWNYQDDFFAGYDHGREAGIISVADHHVVPGKKFWTWGDGPRGHLQDHILTDNDGPYIELMVGAYSDNQPDYSWMQPYETRAFRMNWYPFRNIGGVKNANLDAAVNLEVRGSEAKFGFCVTTAFPEATVRITAPGRVLLEKRIAIDPGHPFSGSVAVPAGVDEHDLKASLEAQGRELVSYSPVRLAPMAKPPSVTPPPAPADIKEDEELDLTGQRIDQFHDPLHDAEPYWREALRRDPGDIGAHENLGRLDLRRARFADAEGHFRQALARLTARYTSPLDAGPYYYLAVALKAEGRNDEAFDAFYKAAWSQEWRAPAYFSLAEIASTRGDFSAALDFVDRSLDANALNIRALGLKASLLRHLDRNPDVSTVLADALRRTDELDVRLMAEAWFLDPGTTEAKALFETLNKHSATAQEAAAEYADAGLYRDGLDLLRSAVGAAGGMQVSPIVYYYMGDFAERLGLAAEAAEYRRLAAQQPPDYVFPFQSEAIPVLRRAIAANPSDARAPYYLGNLLFDWQPEEAVKLWERSAELDPSFPIVWRNLSQAYAHLEGDGARAKAIGYLEKAVAVGGSYPTHFAELDQLYAADGRSAESRLALLESHADVAQKDDGALASLIYLKTFAGKADQAIALLQGHVFHIWESETRFDTGAEWTEAHLVAGLAHLDAGRCQEAIADFMSASIFPENLRAMRDDSSSAVKLAYWTGCAYDKLGDSAKARQSWTEAATPARADGRPSWVRENPAATATQRFYQALAMRKLGQPEGADPVFHGLVETGLEILQHQEKEAGGPARGAPLSPRARASTGHYVCGLGYAGSGNAAKARSEFEASLAASPDNLDAKIALAFAPGEK